MGVTTLGAKEIAAGKLHCSLEEYERQIACGLKWCYKCKEWRHRSWFNKDRSRADGLKAACRGSSGTTRSNSIKLAWVKRKPTFVPPLKGKSLSAEAKAKISKAKKGRPSPRKGTTLSLNLRIKISHRVRERALRGPQCHSYKDGKVAERRGQRFSMEYKRWRFDVFSRDNFTCQQCGDSKGGNLRAHHIKEFADYPELRFDVSNGLTLCVTCHDAHHHGV